MARVYLALSKKAAGFSKLVVLKVLRSSATNDPELRRMFLDEARIAALLNHPNVVQTYEAGDDDGRLFLAMEYLEGKSLSALAAAGPPIALPLDVHLRIIADMLEGLHYAHGIADVDGSRLEVVHRDVSPQNVLVTFAGQSKVVDFGIAKIEGSPATQSGVIKGKVGYMAPEKIHNKRADRRADVFAAGVLLWEAIAKRRLVRRGEDEVASIARRMSGADPSIRTVAPAGTPEELLAICDKAMSHEPDQRHATALELHDALDRYLRKTGGADQKRVAEFLETSYGEQRKTSRAFVEEQLRNADDSSPLIDVSKQSLATVAYAKERDSAGSERQSAGTSAPQVTDVTPQPQPTPPAAPTPMLVAFVVVALGLATLGVVLMLASRGGSSKVAAAATASARDGVTTAAAADAGSTSSATVRLMVQVNAEGATLALDDEPQPLPYQAKLARGSSVHVVARAPGFDDYDRVLALDEDTNVDIALSRATAGAGASSSASSGVANGRGGDRDKAARKKRTIDDGDPYRR